MSALTLAPDGATLVRGTYGAVLVGVRRLPLPLAQVHALAFSPDGSTLAVAGGSPGELGRVCLLDWPSGRVRQTGTPHQDLVVAVAFSRNGKTWASASHDGTARCGTLLLEGHAGPVLDVAFSLEDTEILTACGDGSLRVFDAVMGKLKRTLSQHTDRIHAVALHPKLPRCATASADRTVRLWQPSIGRLIRIVRGFEGSVLCLAFSPDGTRLYTGGEEGLVRVIDAESDTVLKTWKASSDWLVQVAISADGKTLATGDSAGNVRRWDAFSGAPLPSPAFGAGATQRPSGARI